MGCDGQIRGPQFIVHPAKFKPLFELKSSPSRQSTLQLPEVINK